MAVTTSRVCQICDRRICPPWCPVSPPSSSRDAAAIRARGVDALEAVYTGDQTVEWDALADQLEARGLRITLR